MMLNSSDIIRTNPRDESTEIKGTSRAGGGRLLVLEHMKTSGKHNRIILWFPNKDRSSAY